MIHKVYFRKGLIMLLLSLFIVACNKEEELKCEIAHTPVENTNTSKSNNLSVRIYLDGSGSMLGYVKSGETNYGKTLRSIRNVFELSDKLPVEYYRIGSPMQKITSSEYYNSGISSVFYDGSSNQFPEVSSPIDAAIVPPEKEQKKMTVIITDLQQNSGDVTKLNKVINDTYYNIDNRDYAVGIWAIKSEFDGKIYLEGNNPRSFNYSTGQEPAKFRPFYVLFIGPYGDIKHYFSQLKKYNTNQDLLNSDNSNLMIFHPDHVLDKISVLDGTPISLPQGITEVFALAKEGVTVSKSNQEMLKLNSSLKQSSTINYTVNFLHSEYSLPIDPSTIQAQVKGKKLDRFNRKFVEVDSNSEIISAIELKDWQILPKENQAKLTAVIQPNKLSEPGIYNLQFDLTTASLAVPNWWKEWDWQTRTGEEDGSKTYNLQEFFTALKVRTETMQSEIAKSPQHSGWFIGSLCYAIQKD
ncbi:hypothetical protein [Cylindrospermopsis raciborskii]|uniref:Uncharacterized protein n=1 Tax=Cylindrospermopsis raciborskii CS-505 TaxID=533240 RepID=A0A853MA54_9CYAN|nr:hypothetical protein [Cylindrospermopsis raciborskii]EFA70992.1 hypothetical protein CRC_00215 [Cylindrospermopsis raciborskii CS-505]OBU76081.1 hypothetical protein A9P98_06915 [Cylindrospermopsis raciborskii CS-505]